MVNSSLASVVLDHRDTVFFDMAKRDVTILSGGNDSCRCSCCLSAHACRISSLDKMEAARQDIAVGLL